VVRDSFTESCFTLAAEAEFLANSDDDHTLWVFDESISGKTDRFIFRFVRN
jgi:predicted methyltransferase